MSREIVLVPPPGWENSLEWDDRDELRGKAVELACAEAAVLRLEDKLRTAAPDDLDRPYEHTHSFGDEAIGFVVALAEARSWRAKCLDEWNGHITHLRERLRV
jgi:hypothetical protein